MSTLTRTQVRAASRSFQRHAGICRKCATAVAAKLRDSVPGIPAVAVCTEESAGVFAMITGDGLLFTQPLDVTEIPAGSTLCPAAQGLQ